MGVVSEGVVVGIVSVRVVRRRGSGRYLWTNSFMGGQVYSTMCQG